MLRAGSRLLPEEAQLRLLWGNLRGTVTTVDHPEIGFLYAPDFVHTERGGELDWQFVTDEWGFRNASPLPDSAAVVVLGDSQAMGYGVAREESWSERVARAIAPDRIVNLAIAGIGPEQARRIYDTFGVRLHPRTVLFGIFPGNDFTDAGVFEAWLESGRRQTFMEWRRSQNGDAGPLGRLLDRSYVATLARLAIDGGWARSRGVTVEAAGGGRLVLAPSFVEAEAEHVHPGHRDFELVCAAIEAAHADALASGARLAVLLFPTKEEVYMPLEGLPVPDLIAPVARRLEARGIPYLDLGASMREAARTGPALFFEVDGHPNAAGNEVIARAVIDYLGAWPDGGAAPAPGDVSAAPAGGAAPPGGAAPAGG